MLFIVFLGLSIVSLCAVSAGQNKATVVMCGSFSCTYNNRARCTRKEISIYDNIIIGLCLYHSETMDKRIIEPMKKAVERSKPNFQIIDKINKTQEEVEDAELIKNPKSFANWMKKKGL